MEAENVYQHGRMVSFILFTRFVKENVYTFFLNVILYADFHSDSCETLFVFDEICTFVCIRTKLCNECGSSSMHGMALNSVGKR